MEPDADLRDWYLTELRRLGFDQRQRAFLLRKIEEGELELAEFRKLLDERGWSVEQALLAVV